MALDTNQASLSHLPPNQRIFAPQSYQSMREAVLFPIVHVEALAMARTFPLVWAMEHGRPRLMALRSFLRKPLLYNPRRQLSDPRELPLWARAYPFLLSRQDVTAEPSVYVSTEFADKPTDAGAPLYMTDGRLSVGTEQRLRALALYAQHEAVTEAISADLYTANCLIEWALPFAASQKNDLIAGPLLILRHDLTGATIRSLIARHAQSIFHLIGAHRLSLFRAGILARVAELDLKIAPAVD